jgi:predicted metal-dependent RNase
LGTFLRAELKRQPEIRPDVVARARTLLRDPDYPRIEILRNVASQILESPDLSEDES